VETFSVDRLYRKHARFYDATRRFCLPDRKRAVDCLDVCPGHRVIDFACVTGVD
jgi:hypothetical protein